MSHRLKKINALLQRHIAEIMNRELELKPGVFITVSKVDTTSDLRYAHVFVSIFPEKEADYILKTLKKEIYHLQGKLNKKLSMKPLPRIDFRRDNTEAKADVIEKILRNLD